MTRAEGRGVRGLAEHLLGGGGASLERSAVILAAIISARRADLRTSLEVVRADGEVIHVEQDAPVVEALARAAMDGWTDGQMAQAELAYRLHLRLAGCFTFESPPVH